MPEHADYFYHYSSLETIAAIEGSGYLLGSNGLNGDALLGKGDLYCPFC